MATVLSRTTPARLLHSVNTPDYDVADWIINPDMGAVAGQPSKYWIITGDVVTLMDAAAQAAVDSTEQDAARDDVADELDQTEEILRAFALVVLDEINVLRALHVETPRTIAQLKNAVRSKLGA